MTPPLAGRRYGIALVTLSAVLWSTAGLFVRMADLDAWTVLGWRSLFSTLFLGGLWLVRARGSALPMLRTVGAPHIVSASVGLVSTISYVFALKLTTVANVMTLYATLPFFATAVAFAALGERVTGRVLIAAGCSLVGIGIMAGSANAQDLLGIGAALLMTVGFAAQIVHTKCHPGLDMTFVIALTAAACGLVSLPFMQHAIPTGFQLVTLALFGILTTGLAYVLVLDGSRFVSSGETGFLSLLDVVLGPLWVWLFFAEQPGSNVLLGGALVVATLGWYFSDSLRSSAARMAASHGK